jgi:hypothetical protein
MTTNDTMTATDQTKIAFVQACNLMMEAFGCTREEAAKKVNLILEGVAHGLTK